MVSDPPVSEQLTAPGSLRSIKFTMRYHMRTISTSSSLSRSLSSHTLKVMSMTSGFLQVSPSLIVRIWSCSRCLYTRACLNLKFTSSNLRIVRARMLRDVRATMRSYLSLLSISALLGCRDARAARPDDKLTITRLRIVHASGENVLAPRNSYAALPLVFYAVLHEYIPKSLLSVEGCG